MPQTYTGGCLCGAVRYTAMGEPLFSGRCYCNDCRHVSGSGHNAVIGFPDEVVSIRGTLAEYTSVGGSGQPITRRFCPVCSSRVAGRAVVMPGVTMLTASTLDDPSLFVSQMNVFTAHATTWDPPAPDAPAFEGLPPQPPPQRA